MPALQVVPFPKCLARFGIQASSPEAAEVKIHAPRFDNRRRSRVTIHRSAVAERFRVIAVKQFLVEQNFSGFLIDTNRKEIVSVLCRRCQPHLAAHNYRGCPTFIWNLCLPLYIIGFAPVQRQSNGLALAWSGCMPVSPG